MTRIAGNRPSARRETHKSNASSECYYYPTVCDDGEAVTNSRRKRSRFYLSVQYILKSLARHHFRWLWSANTLHNQIPGTSAVVMALETPIGALAKASRAISESPIQCLPSTYNMVICSPSFEPGRLKLRSAYSEISHETAKNPRVYCTPKENRYVFRKTNRI